VGDAERVDDAFLRSLTCVDLVGLTNDDEVGYWRQNLGTKAAIRVGMGFPSFKPMEVREEPIVLFVGNATPQNCTAISWFLSYIWPEVRRRCPHARVRIVGKVCLTVRADVESGVECVGLVSDVEGEYARARIVVAPLVRGTAGVKVKVAEAISHGRPLVTTSVGVDAAAAGQLDDAAFVADGTTEFAQAVVALLTDETLYRAKAAGTRSVFQRCFSYEATYAQFAEWLTDRAAN
jgi:glycosyltransferase involved in cell wall biosynthesis